MNTSWGQNFSIRQRRALTLLIALAGVALALVIGLPLPVLLGPLFACLLAALFGAPLASMGTLSVFMRTFLGVAVGCAVTPALVHELPAMATSLAFVPPFILLVGGVGYVLLRSRFGYDHPTAFYASMPGGLQDMLLFGEEAGGDVRALSLVHATRVLLIVTIAPFILRHLWQLDLDSAPGQAASSTPWPELIWMLIASLAGWQLAARIGLFGASLLGPLILAAAFSLSGLITHRPPSEVLWAAQFFIGLALGSRYLGITLQELRTHVLAGVIYSLAIGLVSVVFYLLISDLHLAEQLDVFLSFLPGGQGEMVIIAILTGADLTYVVSHHLLRLILVILLAPLAAGVVGQWFDRRQ